MGEGCGGGDKFFAGRGVEAAGRMEERYVLGGKIFRTFA